MPSLDIGIDGGRLHAAVDGPSAAPALVLWNGALCSLRMWDRVMPRLADRFRVVRFDIRGTGRSSVSAQDDDQFCFERYAQDVRGLLDALDIARAHLWAMAWGSRAALAFAAWHPDRVITTSLYDASIDPADPQAQKAGAQRALAAQIAAGLPAFEKPEGWNLHDDLAIARRAMTAAGKITLEPLVGRLSMPLLVATGDADPNLVSSRRLVALAPAARLVVMPQVGHASVLQRPDLTTDIFLQGQDSFAAAAARGGKP